MTAALIDLTGDVANAALLRECVDKAVATLEAGGLVAIPTETVYGLAADASNDDAVAGIYAAKGRPPINPLIAHVADAVMARTLVTLSPTAEALIDRYWPGPLTIVAKARKTAQVSSHARAGLETIAIRAPAQPVARAIIQSLDRPIVAPSANPSGALSPTTASAVMEGLRDRIDMVVDGGPCSIGVESTIIKDDGDALTLLRPGGISAEDIEAVTGEPLRSPAGSTIQAPGMLASHYAPNARIRLNAAHPKAGEAYLDFGGTLSSDTRPRAYLDLSAAKELTEAATNLFDFLRRLDAECQRDQLLGIAVAPITSDGIGAAINDRLARAAAPRDE